MSRVECVWLVVCACDLSQITHGSTFNFQLLGALGNWSDLVDKLRPTRARFHAIVSIEWFVHLEARAFGTLASDGGEGAGAIE